MLRRPDIDEATSGQNVIDLFDIRRYVQVTHQQPRRTAEPAHVLQRVCRIVDRTLAAPLVDCEVRIEEVEHTATVWIEGSILGDSMVGVTALIGHAQKRCPCFNERFPRDYCQTFPEGREV